LTTSRPSTRLFAIGAVLLIPLNLFLRPPDSRDPGYMVGYLLGGVGVLLVAAWIVYGIGRWLRRRQTPPRFAAVAFWTFLVFAGVNLMTVDQASRATSLTDAERHGLELGADSIRHASLGFSIPNPGTDFTESPQLQARMDSGLVSHRDIAGWVLSRTDGRANVVLQVIKMPLLDERRFRGFIRGMRSSTDELKGSSVLSDTVLWEPPNGEYRLTVLNPPGIFIQTRCLARSRPDGHFVVCVQTASADSSALAAV